MKNLRKLLNYIMLILIPILLVRIVVMGEASFNQHKPEYITLMVICLYFLIIGIFKRRNSKPDGQELWIKMDLVIPLKGVQIDLKEKIKYICVFFAGRKVPLLIVLNPWNQNHENKNHQKRGLCFPPGSSCHNCDTVLCGL